MTMDTRKQSSQHWTVRFLAVAIVSVILMPANIQAQDRSVQPLVDRLDRLERDIRTLNVQNSRQESEPLTIPASPPVRGISNSGFAFINERLSALESGLRTATGRSEEMAHQLDSFVQRLDKLVSDIDYRLSTLAQSAVPAPAGQANVVSQSAMVDPAPGLIQSPPSPARLAGMLGTIPEVDLEAFQSTRGVAAARPVPVAKFESQVGAVDAVLPVGTPQEQYDFALSFLFKHKYEAAEKALGQFLVVHPSHRLAGNARYWFGETFYVRENYARAAAVFLEGFQKEPKGRKAPDALLKLGMSLANLEKLTEACAAFNKLLVEFLDASPNLLAIEVRERKRARCS